MAMLLAIIELFCYACFGTAHGKEIAVYCS